MQNMYIIQDVYTSFNTLFNRTRLLCRSSYHNIHFYSLYILSFDNSLQTLTVITQGDMYTFLHELHFFPHSFVLFDHSAIYFFLSRAVGI